MAPKYCITPIFRVEEIFAIFANFSREDIFARGYFREKIFSREDIFAGRYFRVKSIFAKISSRENISNSLFAKFSSRENKVLYSSVGLCYMLTLRF